MERRGTLALSTALLLASCANRPGPAPLPELAACEKRDAAACDRLGTFYLYGVSVPKNPLASREYYERACAAGQDRRCLQIAHEAADSRPKDAERYLTHACDRQVVAACGDLGELLLDRDIRRGAALLQRACVSGYLEACPKRLASRLLDLCRRLGGRRCLRWQSCIDHGLCPPPVPPRSPDHTGDQSPIEI